MQSLRSSISLSKYDLRIFSESLIKVKNRFEGGVRRYSALLYGNFEDKNVLKVWI